MSLAKKITRQSNELNMLTRGDSGFDRGISRQIAAIEPIAA
jgi:hypothetical protein